MLEHRFAQLVAFATFLLLVIGGTVNPTGSSLACPEPTFVCNGELFPPMVGGVFYEHGHRLAAMTVGLLQIALTILLVHGRRGFALLLAPHRFVAQERVTLSTSPAWFNGALEPRHVMVRVFAAATPDGSYLVMPGGLTRVSGSQDSILVSTQAGGGSKDTWVISDAPVSTFSLLRPAGLNTVSLIVVAAWMS